MAESQDPTDAPHPPRGAKRYRLAEQGRIVLGPERMIACLVHDLSRTGARIRVPDRVAALPETFELVIVGDALRTERVRLRWRRGAWAGVAFEP